MGFWIMIASFFLGLIIFVLSFQKKVRRSWLQYLLLFVGLFLIFFAIKLAI